MVARHQEAQRPSSHVILDAGAVIALARRDERARARLAVVVRGGATVAVPPVVVAETVRGDGPRDASVNRVIAAVDEVPATDETHGRLAGLLLAQANRSATIDALVVAHAIRAGGAVVLTGDADDVTRLAASHPEVVVEPV